MARPVTKAEQAARDAVAAYVADSTIQNRNTAWHAVFAVSTGEGWFHRATACVWFATGAMGGGIGNLVPVMLGATAEIQELRYRLGLDERPPAVAPDGDEANRDRQRLRKAITRVKYHEQTARGVLAKFVALERLTAELKTEVGQLDLPNFDPES